MITAKTQTDTVTHTQRGSKNIMQQAKCYYQSGPESPD